MSNKTLALLNLILLLGLVAFPVKASANKNNIIPEKMSPASPVGYAQWARTYGGEGDDTAWSVIQTREGDYAFAGTTGTWPFDETWLVKLNHIGEVQWEQTYNASLAYTVAETDDGGYILAGTKARIHLRGLSDAWLAKTDPDGSLEWTKIFDWNDEDEARSVIQTSDGGFLLGGSSAAIGGIWNAWLVKTDRNGILEWYQTYGSDLHDNIFAVLQTIAGGYAFTGSTSSSSLGEFDAWLVTTNSQGEILLSRVYGGSGYDRAYAILQTNDSGFVLAGSTSSYGAGGFDVWLLKTDNTGLAEWNYTFGGVDHDAAYSISKSTDGGYIIAGSTNSYAANPLEPDFFLVKTNENGLMQWKRAIGGPKDDQANAVIQTDDGGFLLAGRTRSFGLAYTSDILDAWLVKTDPDGLTIDLESSPRNWFAIGLLGALLVATISVVALWTRAILRSRKKWD